MQIAELVERSGGLTTRAALIAATSRAAVDAALRTGALVRVGRGRYTVPGVASAAATAHGVNGILGLGSAALHHGWEVKHVPDRPHVVFPRHRNVPKPWRSRVHIHRADLRPDQVERGIATSKVQTLQQCLRSLPDDEALTIADSALRAGDGAALTAAVESVRGAGRAKVLRIAGAASARAANPFESCTRSIACTVPGLRAEPQVTISSPHVWARPDLVDERLRIAIECESFEFHADRAGFRKDVRRYALLTADGWIVLRFIWEDVMFRPAWVREVIRRVVRAVDTRTEVPATWPTAACAAASREVVSARLRPAPAQASSRPG